MKSFLTVCMLVVAMSGWASEQSNPTTLSAIKGEVLEVKDVENYTYLSLKTSEGQTWAAVNKSPVKVGDEVTINDAMVMKNFESKSLKKTFETIIFGTLSSAPSATDVSNADMMAAHASLTKTPEIGDVHVSKAEGADARTIEEIITKSDELKDKPVLVRGKVVKYNPEIMEKNWLHLRDGSGSSATKTDDILVTTAATAKVGDVVLVRGIVRTNKDFGSGYAYKVMIEEATVQP